MPWRKCGGVTVAHHGATGVWIVVSSTWMMVSVVLMLVLTFNNVITCIIQIDEFELLLRQQSSADNNIIKSRVIFRRF